MPRELSSKKPYPDVSGRTADGRYRTGQLAGAPGTTVAALGTAPAPSLGGAGTQDGAGTLSYRVAWANDAGQTSAAGTAGTTATAPVGAPSPGLPVVVTAASPPEGATELRVYGRAAGAETLLTTIPVRRADRAAGAVSWVDEGAVAPGVATPPAADTSGTDAEVVHLLGSSGPANGLGLAGERDQSHSAPPAGVGTWKV